MEQFLGEIRLFSFDFPPKGWLMCQGQTLAINQNQALFALLGTQYGGNGQTTFALPDLSGRIPVHTSPSYPIGQLGGEQNVTLLASQLPAHSHNFGAADSANALSPSGNHLGPTSGAQGFGFGSTAGSGVMQPLTQDGGSQPHNNMMPTSVGNFCIALQGIFPSRN